MVRNTTPWANPQAASRNAASVRVQPFVTPVTARTHRPGTEENERAEASAALIGSVDSARAGLTRRIKGQLGATVLSAFPALVAHQQGTDTVLTGLLDRSALFGVLAEVEALGFWPRPDARPTGLGLSRPRGSRSAGKRCIAIVRATTQ
jgi:hypothetical protein